MYMYNIAFVINRTAADNYVRFFFTILLYNNVHVSTKPYIWNACLKFLSEFVVLFKQTVSSRFEFVHEQYVIDNFSYEHNNFG